VRRLVAVVILLLLFAPSAQAGDEDAGQLFERGLAEMLAGNYSAGCPLIARSYALDPLPGAQFTLAECFAGWGKVASAMEHYRAYLAKVAELDEEARAKQAERIPVAMEKVKELDPRVPRLRFELPASAPDDTTVELDGALVPDPASEREIDPGEHRAVVKLPTGETARTSFILGEGERRAVPLPLPPREPDLGDGDDDGSTLRMAGIVAGAVGIGAVVVGSILGGLALGEKGTIEDNCTDHVCNAEGKSAADRGQSFALGSSVLVPVGAVAVGVGVTLFFLAPDGGDGAVMGGTVRW
jgi:hypothetical protein